MNTIINRIKEGEYPNDKELLPFLSQESVAERASINYQLAEACFVVNTDEHLKISAVFIERAWELSNFDDKYFNLYKTIHNKLGNVELIREAYKRLGIKEAKKNNITLALEYFNKSHNAFAELTHVDKYLYDYDILDWIERLAKPFQLYPSSSTTPRENEKIRLAYLCQYITSPGSVLVKINEIFGHHHNLAEFEIVFFCTETEEEIVNSPVALENINRLRNTNCGFVYSSSKMSKPNLLIDLAGLINSFSPDIFITTAALADLSNLFLISMLPAPIMIALHMGPPPQFVPPSFDLAIGFTIHPNIDSPIDTKLVRLELDLVNFNMTNSFDRAEFNIPSTSTIIYIGGRPQKFQNKDYWKTLNTVLLQHDVYIIISGCIKEQVSFIEEIIDQTILNRIIFTGWRTDYLSFLSNADIVIDTYPSGGGVLLLEAMSMGKPCVCFDNDYMQRYDQTSWNLGYEYSIVDELLIPRNDFLSFQRIIETLLCDSEYREKVGMLCKKHVLDSFSKPERMVKRCEDIYKKIYAEIRDVKHFNAFNTHEPKNSVHVIYREITRISDWLIQQNEMLSDQINILNNEIDNVKKSLAYRIGKLLTLIPRLILKKF